MASLRADFFRATTRGAPANRPGTAPAAVAQPFEKIPFHGLRLTALTSGGRGRAAAAPGTKRTGSGGITHAPDEGS